MIAPGPTRWPLALAGWLLAFAVLPACGLLVSFDDYGTARRKRAPSTSTYAVRGTVEGLEGATVTLRLDAGESLVAGDGPFVFPAALVNGEAYRVTVETDLELRSCAIDNDTGVISDADAGVVVRCASADATLTTLSLSDATLTPSFDPSRLTYEAKVRAYQTVTTPLPTARVTATTRHPRAALTVEGISASSGAPSAPLSLRSGANPILVAVSAPDKRQVGYLINVRVDVNDYLKPSELTPAGQFGTSTAMSGDTIAVLSTEAAHVFVRNGKTWSEQTTIALPSSSFGRTVALDGNTLVIGSPREASNAGAVYVYVRSGTTWSLEASLTASNERVGASFGSSVALSGDTLAVGAQAESSNATGVDGDQTDTSMVGAGAVYAFTRTGTSWSQHAYIKASNTRAGSQFGRAIALSGATLAVGSDDPSRATGINGDQSDVSAQFAGAVYVFTRSGAAWSQEAYVKASNTRPTNPIPPLLNARFGSAVALDGNTLAVGAPGEASDSKGINGHQNNTNAHGSGAAYVFTRSGTTWSQQAYVKASNNVTSQQTRYAFGTSIALAGERLVVGAPNEAGAGVGINSDKRRFGGQPGAVYAFTRTGTVWVQSAYVKASNPQHRAMFGSSLALSGLSLVVGSPGESSSATGVNGDQADDSAPDAGAAYVF